MDDNLFDQDRIKAAQFLNAAEAGAIQAGLNPKQREKVNQYVIDQRNKYVNAAYAASSGSFGKTTPAYIELIQEMNQVKTNLSNLANQQKVIADKQKEYLDDFQADRISKANYDPDSPSILMDIYTGNAELNIDEGGNLMFGKDGQFKRYSELADYSLKATDTANEILNVADKLAASRYRVPNASLKLQKNRVKALIDKGGRNTLLSLMQDDLLPGFNDIDIPKELYKRENYGKLKDFFLSTLDSAMDDVNNNLPQDPRYNKGGGGNVNQGNVFRGKTREERAAILKAADELIKTGITRGVKEYEFTYKGSNDSNTQKYILSVDDNGNLKFRINTPGSLWEPISKENLLKELGFSITEGMTAEEKIQYYNNQKKS